MKKKFFHVLRVLSILVMVLALTMVFVIPVSAATNEVGPATGLAPPIILAVVAVGSLGFSLYVMRKRGADVGLARFGQKLLMTAVVGTVLAAIVLALWFSSVLTWSLFAGLALFVILAAALTMWTAIKLTVSMKNTHTIVKRSHDLSGEMNKQFRQPSYIAQTAIAPT